MQDEIVVSNQLKEWDLNVITTDKQYDFKALISRLSDTIPEFEDGKMELKFRLKSQNLAAKSLWDYMASEAGIVNAGETCHTTAILSNGNKEVVLEGFWPSSLLFEHDGVTITARFRKVSLRRKN